MLMTRQQVDEDEFVDADEAARLLDVQKATVYAYASRGLVRRMASSEGRSRRYRKSDLLRLRARSEARSGHAAVATGALRWGEPVLDTAISGITPEGALYRGKNSVELAKRGARFEHVCEWLWRETWPTHETRFEAQLPKGISALVKLVPAGARPIERWMIALPWLSVRETSLDTSDEATCTLARTLMRQLAALLACTPESEARIESALVERTIAGAFLVALGVPSTPKSRAAVDAALILMADHELNSSTFAARVAASTGASLHAILMAALATFSGPIHGGSCERVELLALTAEAPEDALRIVRDKLRRKEPIPGFGHPLYPEGDPRTEPLFALAEELAPRTGERARNYRRVRAFVDAMQLAGGEKPAVDSGLVAIAAALGLPRGGATALMGMGRIAGWVAHAMEQRHAAVQLRPRARYRPTSETNVPV